MDSPTPSSRKPGQFGLDLATVAAGLRFPWVTLVFLAGLTMTGLLAVRLSLQMSDPGGAGSGAHGLLLSVTDVLVAPYRGAEAEVLPASTTAVFEFPTLLALQAYLLGTLAIVMLIVAARLVVFAATAANRDVEARMPARKRPIFTLQPVAMATSAGSTSAIAGPSISGSRSAEESDR